VRVVYVDTSVLGRVLLNEPDRVAIQLALGDFDEVVSSRLLWIELGRLARRRDAELATKGRRSEFVALADELLRSVTAIPMEGGLQEGEEGTLAEAITIKPFSVATLDAIHLATAVWMVEHFPLDFMTCDRRLAEGAREHGFTVLAPG
jgi:predicted nucleic acid-binding protein